MEMNLPAIKLKTISEIVDGGAGISSRLMGRMNATNQTIPPGSLFYRHLQMDLSETLKKSGLKYDILLHLSEDSKKELTRWNTQMSRWNGKTIRMWQTDLFIESDASNQGRAREPNRQTRWWLQEKAWYINCIELLAATYKRSYKIGPSVLLELDSSSIHDSSLNFFNKQKILELQK